MSSEYVPVYERELDTEIQVSKKTNEEARLKRLERWPREAGLSMPLDESGGNFMQLVKVTASEYGLELGEKKWDIRREDSKIIAKLTWPLLRDGKEAGIAEAYFEIDLNPKSETESNLIYSVKVKYRLAVSGSVLSEKSTEGFVDLSGF
ncbi:MAG: hypothetical protein GXO26_02235 [Crenarchaeota archaeon]|nr:hypothetical protein [Thermoproteota archaeon]